MRITLICGHCKAHVKEDYAAMEINFADETIHFLCPQCKKMNKLAFNKKPEPIPLPKTRRL